MDVKTFKWLTFRVKGGLVYRNKERAMWFGKLTSNGSQTNGKAGIAGLTTYSYNTEALMMFNHSFTKKHNLNGTLGVVYNNKQVRGLFY